MKKVLLLLAKGFESFEASVFIDVIGWNLVDGDNSTKLYTCAFKKEVEGSFGVKLNADYQICEVNINEFDALAIPGGFEEYGFYEEAYHPEFLELIRHFDKQDKIIASICVGELPIAKSGVLNQRMATTYNHKESIRQNQLAKLGAIVQNSPIVIDKTSLQVGVQRQQ
ncbi:4-methyl-5(b-hydroxyethyl)-thiazole monophosphate biosynthesis [Leptospira meyeri]|uniref:4-methyl-5(B-hydroxyethyl)-thiazole monophosphate biosynthesis n=1 Tax=Leptospira meyeri TaxID=29508 RepID=A0A4R8MYZ9_LEPME|nr:DJ-1/PfpI family protein [Leptospira meyeri]EKJ88255.1 DJ-1/PfpI family protein [Leptospira meyeri serovar Hardjo str. Went 5]TDY73087.1 4-methyl-5(b-hydroxyethyl)-thiazole monophosphate biosynthesis [Leptospira meyeri]